MSSGCVSRVTAVLLIAAAASGAAAQCQPGWVPSFGNSVQNAAVRQLATFDPDDTGPAAEGLLGFGSSTFRSFEGVTINGIGLWNGSAWQPLPGGGLGNGSRPESGGTVNAVVTLPTGEFYAAGNFDFAGPLAVSNIARWDGTGWSALGSGLQGTSASADSVSVLTRLPNGDLLAAGNFTSAGGVPVPGIARWDGSAWSAFPAPVIAGFTISFVRIATGSGNTLLALANKASGATGSSPTLLAFDGSSWSELTNRPAGDVAALLSLPGGDVLVGGSFPQAGGILSGVMRWNGQTFSTVEPLLRRTVNALTLAPNGDVLASVTITSLIPEQQFSIARFNGTTWTAVGTPLTGTPASLAALSSGDIAAAGGPITAAGGAPANNLALYTISPPQSLAVTSQPRGITTCSTGLNTFRVATNGTTPLTFNWQWQDEGTGEWRPLTATTADSLGQVVASTNAQTANLQVRPISSTLLSKPLMFRCTIISNCGSATSEPAMLYITPCPCSVADVAGDGPVGLNSDGTVDGTDFIEFLNSFAIGDPTISPVADITGGPGIGNSPDGTIDGNDFIAFINAFALGC